jgi:hypothetical protein
MTRTLGLTVLAATLTACGASSRYVVAIARDVDAPTRASVLESTAKVTAKGAADFAALTPPKSDRGGRSLSSEPDDCAAVSGRGDC